MQHRLGRKGRRGTSVVESAFVLMIFLLFLFGVIEYCRFVYVRQLLENAAREGARYAVVNSADTTVVADTKATVTTRMYGQDARMSNFTIAVYKSDANGNNLDVPGNAQFAQYIAVQLDCDYKPVLPAFLFMGNTLHLRM